MAKPKKKITAKITKESKLKQVVSALVERKLRAMGYLKEAKDVPEKSFEEAEPEGEAYKQPSDPKASADKGDSLIGKDINAKSESLKKEPGSTGSIKASRSKDSGGFVGGEAEITLDENAKKVSIKEFWMSLKEAEKEEDEDLDEGCGKKFWKKEEK